VRTFALPAEHGMSQAGALGSIPPRSPNEKNTMTTYLDPSDKHVAIDHVAAMVSQLAN
jgi:hypothetical protein